MISRRVAVRAIVVKNGKLLCVRQNNYKNKAVVDVNDYWCTPGGGVDIGEPLIPALERELIEETGVKPVVGNLLYVQQFEHGDQEHLEFFFHVTNSDAYDRIDLEATSHGVIEIAEIDFVDPSVQLIKPLFLRQRDITADVKSGVTHFFDYISA